MNAYLDSLPRFCPQCGKQLLFDADSVYDWNNFVQFQCTECNLNYVRVEPAVLSEPDFDAKQAVKGLQQLLLSTSNVIRRTFKDQGTMITFYIHTFHKPMHPWHQEILNAARGSAWSVGDDKGRQWVALRSQFADDMVIFF